MITKIDWRTLIATDTVCKIEDVVLVNPDGITEIVQQVAVTETDICMIEDAYDTGGADGVRDLMLISRCMLKIEEEES
jgi:hypothetical protein